MTKLNRITGAAALFAGLAIASTSALAAPSFIGKLIVTAVAGTCDWNPLGGRMTARFVPAGVGDNGTDSGLGVFFDSYTVGLTRVGGSFVKKAKKVKAGDIWAGSYPITGANVKFTTQEPAIIAADTDFVNVTGHFIGVIAGPLCDLSFTMSVAREVN